MLLHWQGLYRNLLDNMTRGGAGSDFYRRCSAPLLLHENTNIVLVINAMIAGVLLTRKADAAAMQVASSTESWNQHPHADAVCG